MTTMTEVRSKISLSRRELQTLFYVGRKLELIGCYMRMCEPSPRIVREQKSFGYIMDAPKGKSWLRFETGNKIVGVSAAGNGFTEVKIVDENGQVAAHYRLL